MATMINPRTGMPFETDPDEVSPDDLQKFTSTTPTLADAAAASDVARLGPLEAPGVPVLASGIPDEAPSVPQPSTAMDGAPVPIVEPSPLVAPKAHRPAAGAGGGGSSQDAGMRSELAGVNRDSADAAAKAGDAGIGLAKAKDDVAAADAKARAEQAGERLKEKQAAEAESTRLQGKAEAEDAKYKAMGFKDFWADKTTGARVLGAISVALGAAGASLAGGPNYAMEIIDKAIDRDYQRQRDAILKQKDVVSEARGMAKDAKADKLVALEGWRKAAYEQVEAQGRATLAKQGVPIEEANKAALVSGAREKALESKMAVEKGIATIAETRAGTTLKYAEAGKLRAEAAAGPGGKPLTADQAKAADLGGRMLQDHQTIGQVGPMSEEGMKRLRVLAATEKAFGSDPKVIAGMVAKGVLKTPDQVLNDHDRQAYRAGSRFANSVLRGDSGGAITTQEFLDFTPNYLPTLGDKQQDMAAKSAAREQIIQGKLRGAGGAAADVVNSVRSTPATASNGRRGKVDGKPAIIHPDGTYELVQ